MWFGKFDIEDEILLEGGSFSTKKNLCLGGFFSKFEGDWMRGTAQAANVAGHAQIHLQFESWKTLL